jgi:hypothetical protein
LYRLFRLKTFEVNPEITVMNWLLHSIFCWQVSAIFHAPGQLAVQIRVKICINNSTPFSVCENDLFLLQELIVIFELEVISQYSGGPHVDFE